MVAIAAAVVVPLALPLMRTEHRAGIEAPTYRAARAAVRVSGVLLAVALLFRGTLLGMAFAAPWVLASLMVAMHGVARFATRPRKRIEESLLDLGALYLPVGAIWAFVYVAGLPLMGFVGT